METRLLFKDSSRSDSYSWLLSIKNCDLVFSWRHVSTRRILRHLLQGPPDLLIHLLIVFDSRRNRTWSIMTVEEGGKSFELDCIKVP